MEENLENMEEKQKSAEGQPKAVGEKTGGMEGKPEDTREPAADRRDDKSKDSKRYNKVNKNKESNNEDGKASRKKTAAYVEVTAAFLMILLSIGLFLNTRGTRLLHVSVIVGRISRYYWIFLLAAVVSGVTGLVTVKHIRAGKQQKDSSDDKKDKSNG